MHQYKIIFSWFSLFVLFSFQAEARKVILDFEEDYSQGFSHDHFESRKYFDSVEQLLGVSSVAMNQTRIGIWLYESQGIGGCCGGQFDITNSHTMFNHTDSIEILVKYWSNKEMSLTPVIGELVEIKEKNEAKDVFPPSSGIFFLNWRTIVAKIDPINRKFRIVSQLGMDRSGFFLLDKIVVGINEPAI